MNLKKHTLPGTVLPIAAFVSLMFALLGSCVNPDLFIPRAVQGMLDLTKWSFSGPVPAAMDGEWEFYPGRLLDPGFFRGAEVSEGDASAIPVAGGSGGIASAGANPWFIEMPDSGVWSSLKVDGKPLSPYGCATWRLRFVLPPGSGDAAIRIPEIFSASRVFLDGELAFSAGAPAATKEDTVPWYRTGVVRIDSTPGVHELVIQAANFGERRGGINRSLWIGSVMSVQTSYIRSLAMDLIVFGSLLTIGIYHLFLFGIRRKDRSPLWFGIFCIIIAARSLLYGERFAFDLFGGVPWEVFNRLDHLTFYIGIPVFSAYIMHIFDRDISRIAMNAYQILGLAFALLLFFPPTVFNVTVVWYELITGVYVLYLLFIILRALFRRREGALTTMIGIFIFLCFGINEILFNMGMINTFNSLSIGLVLFLFTQSVLIAMRFSKAFDESEHLGRSLLNLNESLRRFIPQEFFMLLKREEVAEIRLGDQVEKNMTIMFSDIRRFTLLAEQLGAAKTFEFLNDYFGRIGDVIRANGGFIDKYLGDGFIALFPVSPDAALKTAIGIQRVVTEFNATRAAESLPPIEVGIGLNYGPLILGTVGEEHRMDTTVIADSVNLCSRLEGLCKHYGKGIIVPFEFLDLLEDPAAYHWRYLGLIRVQGRKKPVETVHIYDGLEDETYAMFDSSKTRFEEALHAYRNGDYEAAMHSFRALAVETPDDPAVFTFITQIHRLMTSGLVDEWDGIDTPAK